MPRRRVLTETHLTNLLALPVAEPDLVRHWTLSSADLVAIGRRRRDRNRLGFALQLCALRCPGRLLRPDKLISSEALHFVAEQLRINPDALTLQVTPSGATSRASVFDHPTRDKLRAFDTPRFGMGATTPDDVLVTTRPHWAERIPGCHAVGERDHWNQRTKLRLRRRLLTPVPRRH